ncbi:OmpW family outer membrane protein [Syntrophotalea carbinolica DSM 2380]|uniref:OmpW family outer membrane protein n=1 Tax=Syntrophotalea carbinolica (strain DSM 2380 / NBRC 103641 / GraBd1) TaxID=338963 RepID=Q3A1Z0_SYNC1|nr:OmpW family outer membrane protein [Syntrophotalea carbinolica]ABA89617.1 OmpW family outer membrane protein [Syntrophotalea carbinolica DSM 2380]
MKNRIVGIVLAAMMVVFVASVATAADDFKRYSVGVQMMFLNPDVDSVNPTASLISAEDTMTGGLTLEYFFTPNFSTELVAAIAHVDLEVGDNKVGSGEAWLLPPSLYIKYHPMPQWKVSPYVGVGVDWVYAWDETVVVGGQRYSLDIEDSFGWAAKVGADIKITENLYANVDVMYLDNETEVNSSAGLDGTDLDLKVWSYNIGMKYRF